MNILVTLILLIAGIILFLAAHSGKIQDKTLQRLANVGGIIGTVIALFLLLRTPDQQVQKQPEQRTATEIQTSDSDF